MEAKSQPSAKTIIVTGASRGIGHAIANSLLRAKEPCQVVLVARTEGPMMEMKREFGERVVYIVGDLGKHGVAAQVLSLALQRFSQIDSLIINHGTLHPVARIADTVPADWKAAFETNVFSALSLIIPTIPHLRLTHGTVLLVSSGASVSTYSTWGPYSCSKACLNTLAATLGREEPDITTLAVRPGTVDTDMMREVRKLSRAMDAQDRKKFMALHEEGMLLGAEMVGGVLGRVAVGLSVAVGGKRREVSGRFLSWDDEALVEWMYEV